MFENIESSYFKNFQLPVSTDHLKHATAKIQVSHETIVINDYWKTLTFYNCYAKSCLINNLVSKYNFL